MKFKAMRAVAPALLVALAALPAAAQTYSVTNLGLGGPVGSISIAAVNARGDVAGTSPTSTAIREIHAFFATQADGNIDIGTLGSNRSDARAMNASGQVVGHAETVDSNGNFVDHAFSWTRDGGIVDLGALGGLSSYAIGVNDAGTVIVQSLIAGNQFTHASHGRRQAGWSTWARSAVIRNLM